MKKPTLPFFLLLCMALSLVCPPACADPITLHFQDLGVIADQSITVYNLSGVCAAETNTSGTIELDSDNSWTYTIQLQPSPINQTSKSLLDSLLALISGHALEFMLVFAVIFLIFRRH
ncbi:MAG: hypothetical protein D4R45_03215 [Planctomycetaceae bacterium]|nr:MAG: hypothetical protein D4R45_03215 [Planctomycetaceae bacterium]